MIFLLLYAQLTAHGCYIVAATLSKIHVLCGVGSVQFSPSLLQRHGITPLSQTGSFNGHSALPDVRQSSLLSDVPFPFSGQVATSAVMGRHLGPGSIDAGIENQNDDKDRDKSIAGIPALEAAERGKKTSRWRWGLETGYAHAQNIATLPVVVL